MSTKKHDFKRLDVERAQISVSIADARDIVSQWLGADFDEDEANAHEASFAQLPSATAGLGSRAPAAAPAATNKALEKLKRTQMHKERALKDKQAPKPATAPSESESEDESRTSTVKGRAKRPTSSALESYKNAKRPKKRR